MNEPGQCRFMAAAYPMLNGYDTCQGFHRHEKATFDLAAALAAKYQDTPTPSMEQVAWFLNDAQSIIDKLVDVPDAWHVEDSRLSVPRGCDHALTVGGVEFLIPESEWEPALPELRQTWLRDRDLTEQDVDRALHERTAR